MDRLYAVLSLLVVSALIVGAFLWSQHKTPAPVPPVAQVPPAPKVAPVTPPPQAPQPAIKYPVEATPAPTPLPSLGKSDAYVRGLLIDLLGRKAVVSFLHLNGFVRRVVATVDNLPRHNAPVRVWPVKTTPGHFSAVKSANGLVVSSDNALRYSPFVIFVESIDTARAVALYKRLYPLFQKAYRELGNGGYFNDRLISVIDLLLATPEPATLNVQLTQVRGPIKSIRPWTRYRFSDPDLEALPAGQKMLIRTGLINERRLKAKLADFRRHLTGVTLAK